MRDSAEIERKLKALTSRQSEILYRVCQGDMDYVDIGEKLGYSEKTIQSDMSKLYKAFGLTKKSMPEKRRILVAEVCPLHLARVAQPEIGNASEVIIIDTEPEDLVVIEEVKKDAKGGFVPLGALVVVTQKPTDSKSKTEPQKPSRGELVRRPDYTIIDPKEKRKTSLNPWLLILVGILATLVVVLLIGIGFLIFRGSGSPSTTAVASNPTQPPVVITQPPVIQTQPAQTVLITTTPLAPAAPVVVTVLVPQTPPPATVTIQTVVVTQTSDSASNGNENSLSQGGPSKPAGQDYSLNGVTVRFQDELEIARSNLGISLVFENRSGRDAIIRYKNSYFHLEDNLGNTYFPDFETSETLERVHQYLVKSGETRSLISDNCNSCNLHILYFRGPIDPDAEYLIFKVDQMAGMENLIWKMDLQ